MENRFMFRFWDEIIEYMMDGRELHIHFNEIIKNPDVIPMQCTGLKDRNGELIYEGDIVEYTTKPSKKQDPRIKPLTENYKVVWSDRFTGYLLQTPNGVDCQSIAVVLEQIEVIGNIYEDPELLETGNE